MLHALDPVTWLSVSGIEVKNIIPLTKFAFYENNFCQESTIISGPICAFEQQLEFFSQIMTLQPSKFIGRSTISPSQNFKNHFVDISLASKGFGAAGIVITYDENSNVSFFWLVKK